MAIKSGKNKFLRAASKKKKAAPELSLREGAKLAANLDGIGGFQRRDPKLENIGLQYEHYPQQRSKPFPWITPIEGYDEEQNLDLVFRVQLDHATFVDISVSDADLERISAAALRALSRRINRLVNAARRGTPPA